MIPATFMAGWRLWFLLVIPVLAGLYVWRQRRRQTYAIRFSAVPLLGDLAQNRPGWRRHVVAVGLLLSLLPLIVAFARPAKETRVPKERATVVLAIDVSLSMEATDVSPSRLKAAQEAAKKFAGDLPKGLNVGLVSFSQGGNVLVPPTTDRLKFNDAVDRLELGPYTAIGEGIFSSLQALKQAPTDPSNPNSTPPAAVVVLSDGETTYGRPNSQAADAAKKEKVPVSTIAFGTDHGTITYEGQQSRVPVNKQDLKVIADTTGGKAYEAESLGQLDEVYRDIGSAVGYDKEYSEISARWTGLGLLLLLMTVAGSLGWFGRLP